MESRLEKAITIQPPTQAEKILAKFGGAMRLYRVCKMLGYTINFPAIYKWTYPRSRGGTNGLIPTSAWPMIHRAARLEGIIITSEDIDPRSDPIKIVRGKNVLP